VQSVAQSNFGVRKCHYLVDGAVGMVSSLTLQKSFTTSETFESCRGRGSTEPVSAHRDAMAKDDLPLPLLKSTNSGVSGEVTEESYAIIHRVAQAGFTCQSRHLYSCHVKVLIPDPAADMKPGL
jgi:hypothetical protein